MTTQAGISLNPALRFTLVILVVGCHNLDYHSSITIGLMPWCRRFQGLDDQNGLFLAVDVKDTQQTL